MNRGAGAGSPGVDVRRSVSRHFLYPRAPDLGPVKVAFLGGALCPVSRAWTEGRVTGAPYRRVHHTLTLGVRTRRPSHGLRWARGGPRPPDHGTSLSQCPSSSNSLRAPGSTWRPQGSSPGVSEGPFSPFSDLMLCFNYWLFYLFLFMYLFLATPLAYGSSWARDQTLASKTT